MKRASTMVGIIVIVVAAGVALSQHTSKQSQIQTSVAVKSDQNPGTYTMAQVAAHNSGSSCWTAIDENVYDVTKWINQHPGGTESILMLCGTDGSSAFNDQHGGQKRPASELAAFKIGILAR